MEVLNMKAQATKLLNVIKEGYFYGLCVGKNFLHKTKCNS